MSSRHPRTTPNGNLVMLRKGDTVLMVMRPPTPAASAALTAKQLGRRSQKKGSSVTENRARAQRAKLDQQAEARLALVAQEQVEGNARKSKTARQDREARRRSIAA